MVPLQTFDMDLLFHIHQASLRQEQHTYWYLIITPVVCAVAIFGILYLSLRSCLHNLITRYSTNTVSEPSTTNQNPSSATPEPRQRSHIASNSDPERNVTFTAYSLH